MQKYLLLSYLFIFISHTKLQLTTDQLFLEPIDQCISKIINNIDIPYSVLVSTVYNNKHNILIS